MQLWTALRQAQAGLKAYLDAQWVELLFAQRQQERMDLLSEAQLQTIASYYRMLQWTFRQALNTFYERVTNPSVPYHWETTKLFERDSMKLVIENIVKTLDEATQQGRQQITLRDPTIIPTQSIREVVRDYYNQFHKLCQTIHTSKLKAPIDKNNPAQAFRLANGGSLFLRDTEVQNKVYHPSPGILQL